MSGKDRRRAILRPEPFDLARLATGEALAIVELPDGRTVAGRLYIEEMLVPTGEEEITPATAEATRKRRSKHLRAVLAAGRLRDEGLKGHEIVARMTAAGLLLKGTSPDDPRPLETVRGWLRKDRVLTGRTVR